MRYLFYLILLYLIINSCRKNELGVDKNCKECENQIQMNDSIFNTIVIDTSWNRYEVYDVVIEDDCFKPRINFSSCYLECSDYTFYAINIDSNFYEVKWLIYKDYHCEAIGSGRNQMPINISKLQDSTKNEVFLKLYNYDEVISYKY